MPARAICELFSDTPTSFFQVKEEKKKTLKAKAVRAGCVAATKRMLISQVPHPLQCPARCLSVRVPNTAGLLSRRGEGSQRETQDPVTLGLSLQVWGEWLGRGSQPLFSHP